MNVTLEYDPKDDRLEAVVYDANTCTDYPVDYCHPIDDCTEPDGFIHYIHGDQEELVSPLDLGKPDFEEWIYEEAHRWAEAAGHEVMGYQIIRTA